MTVARSHMPEDRALRLAGPLYLQIAEHMRHRVTSGEWTPNQSIPNENDLALQYQVSLGTMRKALEHLVRLKLVVRQQGRGTFVLKRGLSPNNHYWSFALSADGFPEVGEAHVDLTSKELKPATTEVAARLGVTPGATVAYLECRTRFGEYILCLDTIVVPVSSCPGLDTRPDGDERGLPAPFQALLGLVVQCVDRIVPAMADAADSALLRAKPQDPILEIERQALDGTGNVLFAIRRRVAPESETRYAIIMQ